MLAFVWIPSHRGIEGNEKADAEAKKALENPADPHIKTTLSDAKKYIYKLLHLDDSNAIISDKTLTRKDQVNLTRLKLEHTNLTHIYLIGKKEPPICSRCFSPLSVKHFLYDYLLYQDEKRQAQLPQQDFNDSSTEYRSKLLRYIKITKMHNKA